MKSIIDELIDYFKDTQVEEVFLNGDLGIGILKAGKHVVLPQLNIDKDELIFEIQKFALTFGIRLDPFYPSAGGMLLKQSIRWHVVIPPAAPHGPVISLRKQKFDHLEISHFFKNKVNIDMIREIFISKHHLIICGETGSGKTSCLSSCLKEWALNDRILMMEDLEEIPLFGKLWTKLLTRKPTTRGDGELKINCLLKECFRLRPDRIIFGELRDVSDFQCFLDALASGHSGIVATMHAATLEQIKHRFESAGLGIDLLIKQNIHCLFLSRNHSEKKLNLTSF